MFEQGKCVALMMKIGQFNDIGIHLLLKISRELSFQNDGII